MPRPPDTIVAPATPAGASALAIVRISGPDTKRLLAGWLGAVPPARVARHVDYVARSGERIDGVVAIFYQAPRSYTGEDTLELSCHGNPFIVQKIVEDLLARGCRSAEPGEFTQRSFLNGRMDLSQAEAVMDVIHAHSERALAAAQQQLRGSLSKRLAKVTTLLLDVIARIEACIDFPDEDLPTDDREALLAGLEVITLDINGLLATRHYGDLLRDGIKTVIVGAPNVGKSSLLNRLTGKDRALVSAEPGTTRDYLEERILIGPHCFRLIDTAGLNPSPAPLEKLGIEKTMECIEGADLLLLVHDVTIPAPPAELAQLAGPRAVFVLNKVDLVPLALPLPDYPDGGPFLISAATGFGLERLKAALVAKVDRLNSSSDDLIAISARHAQALADAREGLASAAWKLGASEPIELVASDLRSVLAAVGEIVGRIDNERMLDRLFATFCIGK